MTWLWVDREIPYTGAELRSHWIRENFGLQGDGGVGFVGSCDVAWEHTIDMDERVSRERIAGDRMLHILCEHFRDDLKAITLRQRLLCALALEQLLQHPGGRDVNLLRRGDDLYAGKKKLSVSIATVSLVSGLIHLGINITTQGVPVEAISLQDMGIDPENLACALLPRFAEETHLAESAMVKVRPAR